MSEQAQNSTINNSIVYVVDIDAPSGACTVEKGQGVFTAKGARYCPRSTFKGLTNVQTRLYREMTAIGVRMPIGFVIKKELADKADSIVEKCRKQFEMAVDELRPRLGKIMKKHLDENPELEPYKEMIPKPEWVLERASFTVYRFEVGAVQGDGFEKIESGIKSKAIREIAVDVRDAWRYSKEKGSASQKVKGVLKRVKTKLRSLVFFDEGMNALIREIERVEATLPNTGIILDADFVRLSMLMEVLENPSAIERMMDTLAANTPVKESTETEVFKVEDQVLAPAPKVEDQVPAPAPKVEDQVPAPAPKDKEEFFIPLDW